MSYVRDELPDYSAANIDVALRCAAAGLATFPCAPDKRPLTEHGFDDATTHERIIRGCWAQNPGALTGVATEAAGLMIIDLDRKPGKPDGVAAWEALIVGHEADVASAPVVQKPTNGRHVYFRRPVGMEPTNRTGALPKGIDVRGRGYVISAGAMLANGAGWLVASDSLSPIEDIESIPELPQW